MPKRSGPGGQFDSFYELFSNVLGRTAEAVVPKCHICGLKAVPLQCQNCGQYGCLDHAWMNAKRAQAICDSCVVEAFGTEDEPEEDMPAGWDPWAELGVGPEASFEDVKRAFRRKALQCHPDKGGTPERFKELKRAYDAIVKLMSNEEE